MLAVNSCTSTSSPLNSPPGSMVQILNAFWSCHSWKICNAHEFVLVNCRFQNRIDNTHFFLVKSFGCLKPWTWHIHVTQKTEYMTNTKLSRMTPKWHIPSKRLLSHSISVYCLINEMQQQWWIIKWSATHLRSYTKNSCFVLRRGIQIPRNNNSSQPSASCFYLFLGVWIPQWSPHTRFWYIT